LEKIVIIPTYKEKENIRAITEAVFGLQQGYHILVIDDNSPDGTAQIVKDLMVTYPEQLFLLERSGKLGLGTAYITGFNWALERGYQYIMEMDADFSHNPADLERLYLVCKSGEADVAIGSRYVPGGKTENWPLDRHIYSKGGAFYTKMITWMPVNDPTAGFVCYSRKVLASMNLDQIKFVGYAFQIEMKLASWKLGFRLKEVPITFVDIKEGTSKMSKGIGVLQMQWNSLLGHYRKKVKKQTV
jgi:dolichol-phosphate mannosyltransferase